MNFLYSLAPLKKGQEWKNNLEGGGGRREKQMPKCSSSVDRCWRWLTCLLIKSWWFRRLNQGYYEKATHSAKIASKRWRSLVRNPQWVSRSCWHSWVNAFFFLFFFSIWNWDAVFWQARPVKCRCSLLFSLHFLSSAIQAAQLSLVLGIDPALPGCLFPHSHYFISREWHQKNQTLNLCIASSSSWHANSTRDIWMGYKESFL